jgi:hypothetical protein
MIVHYSRIFIPPEVYNGRRRAARMRGAAASARVLGKGDISA